MSTLDRRGLLEACREIYLIAADDFMLPPLLRDVTDFQTRARRTYYVPTSDDKCVSFSVELDTPWLDENGFPLTRLPLIFNCGICDIEPERRATLPLDDAERRALVRAFFLGVKMPVNAELIAQTTRIQFSAQLSASFFVDCGELGKDDCALEPEAICSRVSAALYEKSREFFDNPQEGLAVWGMRARQELLGDQPPAPEDLWPDVIETDAPREIVPAADMTPVETTQDIEPVRVPLAAVAPPVAPMSRVAPPPTIRETAIHWRLAPLAAALVTLFAFAATERASFSPPAARGPETRTITSALIPERAPNLPAALAPAPRPEPPPAAAQAAPPARPPKPDCDLPLFAAGPAQPLALQAARATPVPVPQKPATVVAKADARPHAAPAPASKGKVTRRPRSEPNPIVQVGQAASRLLSGVFTNLRKLPTHLSAIVSPPTTTR
jgi:hypothetical protein